MKRLEVAKQIVNCTACELHEQCTLPVPLRGAPGPIAVVGEAPGEQEDLAGQPFVGPAGKLLGELLLEAQISEPLAFVNTVSCLKGNTQVFLADGRTERIDTLVRERYDGDVLCADAAGDLVARRVVGWHCNERAGRTLYRVTHQYARLNMHGPVGVTATGDHEVLTERGWCAVEELEPFDRIHTGMPGLDNTARQLIISGLLGDATVDNRTLTQIEFCSGADEQAYITAKRSLLPPLDGPTCRGRGWPSIGPIEPSRGTGGGWRFRLTHPKIKPYAQTAAPTLVRMLDDFGLALWYMDDGHLRVREGRQPDAQISIARMDPDEAEVVAKEIRSKGIPVQMRQTSMGPRLMFGVEGTRTLLARIGRYIHPDHDRKAPGMHRTDWPTSTAVPLWGLVAVTPVDPVETVYCLSVEQHQNFVTVGGVVHNCFPHGTPTWDHLRSCENNKWTQLDYINPRYILLLGKVALKGMRPELELKRARARPFLIRDRVCFGTYHPAAALRNHNYEETLRFELSLFRQLLDAEDWRSMIPGACAACSLDAEWWEDGGLGWCRTHLPDQFVAAYDARHALVSAELDAARRRDTALQQVAQGADPDWMAAAWDALIVYLKANPTFFVDDFWQSATLDRPRESRALGPIVLRAAREGHMRKSGQFRKSTASNMTEKPVWESKIYTEANNEG